MFCLRMKVRIREGCGGKGEDVLPHLAAVALLYYLPGLPLTRLGCAAVLAYNGPWRKVLSLLSEDEL